jgi:protein-S-isoprenylcysteine O-methyltransferase Ste14
MSRTISEFLQKQVNSIRKFLSTPRLVLTTLALILQFAAWSYGFTEPASNAQVCAGLIAVMAGMAIRAGVTIYMERRKTWGLLTHGPFAVARHPRYVGTVMVVAGLMVTTGFALYGLWLVPLLLTIVPHVQKAREESRGLAIEYPDDFPSYRVSFWNVFGPRQGLGSLTWPFFRRHVLFPVILTVVAGVFAYHHCEALPSGLVAIRAAIQA